MVICGVSFPGISVVGGCKQAPGAEFLSRAFCVSSSFSLLSLLWPTLFEYMNYPAAGIFL
jgi:hypothetical protein